MLKGFVSGVEKDITRIPMLVGNEYKEGWEVRDNQDRLIWGREDEFQTTTGTLPFKGYGLPVKVKSLLGNGVQNETPTPDAPIQPEFVGVRTANLFDYAEYVGTYMANAGLWEYTGTTGTVFRIPCTENTVYTLSLNKTFSLSVYRIATANTNSVPTLNNPITVTDIVRRTSAPDSYSFTTPAGAKYILFQVNASVASEVAAATMLNSGSAPLPYEPYGYKTPFTCAGQTVPVYLGQTQTVRRIKKLVLTGEETWGKSSVYQGNFYSSQLLVGCDKKGLYCTHAVYTPTINQTTYNYGKCAEEGSSANKTINLFLGEASWTVEDFKSYLANQYQNGTPVIIWYVLTNPEIGIVNESLRRIGNYADELNDTVATLPDIPTAIGQNTITVDTTLAPSMLTVMGHIKEPQPENLLPVSYFEDLSDPSYWSGGYYIRYSNMPAGTYVMTADLPEKDPGDVYFNGENASNVPYVNRPVSLTINEGDSFYVLFFVDRGLYDEILDGTYTITLFRNTPPSNLSNQTLTTIMTVADNDDEEDTIEESSEETM